MTMAEQNPVAHLLDGMVSCRNCSTPMVATGESFGETPTYVCSSSPESCDTPEVPAEALARLTVERVIRTTLEGENVKRVVEIVQEDARHQDEEYSYAKFLTALRSMDDLYGAESFAAPPSRALPEPDPEMLRLLELDPGQYIEPLRRLDRYWSVTGDTGHIEQYAFDLNTYLRPSNIRTTRAIIETAVAEISVGAGSATIGYRTPMPPGSGTEGKTQEEVDLPS